MEVAELKKEGSVELYISKRRKWKTVYLKVASDSLQIFKDKKMTKIKEERKKSSFTSVKMVEFPPKDGQFVFEIKFDTNNNNLSSMVLSVPTNDNRTEWMEALLPTKLKKSFSDSEFTAPSPSPHQPKASQLPSQALECYYPPTQREILPYPVPICIPTTQLITNTPPYPIQSRMPTPPTVITASLQVPPPYPLSPTSNMPQPLYFASQETGDPFFAYSKSSQPSLTPPLAMPCSPVSPVEISLPETDKFQFPPETLISPPPPPPLQNPSPYVTPKNDPGYVVMRKAPSFDEGSFYRQQKYDQGRRNSVGVAPIGFEGLETITTRFDEVKFTIGGSLPKKLQRQQNISIATDVIHEAIDDSCNNEETFTEDFDHQISASSISNLEKIGQGNFGEVFKADYSIDNSVDTIKVAVKTLKGDSNKQAKEEMLKEFSVMANMVHPNIVRLYGVVIEDNTNPSIVLEYFPHGDLKSYLIKSPEKSVGTLIKYMIDIAMGMHYIAQKGLIHRDLAARNVLVGEGEMCKVADFGLIRELPSDMSIYYSQSILPLPIRWMPPEAITDKLFSEASDVWSYGILQWELFNPNLLPYKDMTNQQVCTKVEEGYRLPIPQKCPPLVAKLMESCWEEETAKRPTFLHITSILTRKISVSQI